MRRLVLVPAGVLIGFVAAATVLAVGLTGEIVAAPPDAALGIANVLSLVLAMATNDALGVAAGAVWRALLWVCLAPLCLVAVVAELAGLRSLRWLAGGTGAATALVPTILRTLDPGTAAGPATPLELRLTLVLLLAGVAGGAAFWSVAGRRDAAARQSACNPAENA